MIQYSNEIQNEKSYKPQRNFVEHEVEMLHKYCKKSLNNQNIALEMINNNVESADNKIKYKNSAENQKNPVIFQI